ncbi:PAS domain S-box protein [Phreatobacter aquaticus]|uniref:histidine kinase n=1 Tax=Phreatobacter aquaticus TaxID=2570229 RepID=A0A4D7QIW3_9HYPH|nr:PAS domain S-box protein [Phreatobacter aquaticus]QCK85257.1 PAS domain S-box protein [Phreatobacter aquaticus]
MAEASSAGPLFADMFDDKVLAPAGRLDPAILARLFDAIPARVTAQDADHRYVYANRQALDLLGYRLEDIVGRSYREIVGDVIADRAAPLVDELKAGRAVQWSDWAVYPNGLRRFVEQIYSPCITHDGALVGYIAFIRDTTDLKLREEALEEQVAALNAREAVSSAILATSLDPIVVVDEEGLLEDLNPAAVETFGYSRQEAIGRSIAELIVPESSRGAHAAGMARYKASGISRVLDKRIQVDALRRDGSVLPVEMTISEIRLPLRRVFTAHLRDLTAARHAEALLAAQRDRLHQAEKLSAMGSLLAGVAHELNNPLAILVAQSTLLVETAPSPEIKRRAERIHAAAERSGRIVKSFLAMARQRPEKREPTDLNDLVKASVDMLGYGLRTHGITVDQVLDPALPKIMADHDFLGQVIANLIINAQHALTDRPEPRRIGLTTRTEPGFAIIEISDNGAGVPDALAERIFEPYFTTKPAGVGTGIGLSICRTVVESHGGTITLGRSDQGGARFTVRLPAETQEGRAVAAGIVASPALSILVIDDETDVRDSLAEMLELLGHDVVPIQHSAETLDQAAVMAADLAFVDLRMPGTDGLRFRDRLVAINPALANRVVIMTGDAVEGPGAIQRKADNGQIPMMEKPFGLAEVRHILETVGGLARRS